MLFYHFGLMLNDKNVIHFASKSNNMFAGDQGVRINTIEDFSINRKTTLVYCVKDVDSVNIMNRAQNYWGNRETYSLHNNNCILFILWCLTMEEKRNIFTVVKYYVLFCKRIIQNNLKEYTKSRA